jgi:hypothetical protein
MVNTRKADTTLPEIGLYNSSLALVTGRPDYQLRISGTAFVSNPRYVGDDITLDITGLTPGDLPLDFEVLGEQPENCPINPVTGLEQILWKHGIIDKDIFGEVVEAMDPTLGGSYSTMSFATVLLMNNLPGLDGRTLFRFLQYHSIDPFRCEIIVCVFVDGACVQWSEPQIERLTDAEHTVMVESVDAFLKIHKDVLKIEISESVFPTAPEDSRGKFVPLCLGRIPEAEGRRVSGSDTAITLIVRDGMEIKRTRASAWVAGTRTLTLITQGVVFEANDSRLVGNFIEVAPAGLSGDQILSPIIISNSITTGTELTVVVLSDSFRDQNEEVAAPVVGAIPTVNSWWFKVSAVSEFQALSDGQVSDASGPLLGWSENLGEFFPVTQIEKATYQDADYSEVPGLAGVLLFPRGENLNVPTQRNLIVPQWLRKGPALANSWQYEGLVPTIPPPTDEFGAFNADLPLLIDRVSSTGYSRAWSITIPTGSAPTTLLWNIQTASVSDTNLPLVPVDFMFQPPEGMRFDDDERLKFGIKMSLTLSGRMSSAEAHYEVGVIVQLVDATGSSIYSTPYRRIAGGPTDVTASTTGTTFNIDSFSGDYFDPPSTASPWGLIDVDYDDTLDPDQRSLETLAEFLRSEDLAGSFRLRVRLHIRFDSFFQNSVIDPLTAPFGFTVKEIGLFRARENYEGAVYKKVTGAKFGGTWGGRKTASDPILSIPDAIEYLIRERDGSTAIDTDSFDLCLARRPAVYWHIGRQITEQAVTPKGSPGTTRDLIAELCKTGFLSVVPGRDKNRRLINLDGYDGATGPITDIIDGSMGEGQVVGLDRVFTGCEFKYDKNPATGEYRSSVFIRKTSEDAFPGPDELVPGTTTPLWTTYAGGFGSDYPTAITVWERYHSAFVLTQRENFDKQELDWCQSNARLGLDTSIPDVPVFLALIRSEWYSVPRKQYTFRVPVTASNLVRLLGDRVIFRDIKRTGNLYFYAIVEEQALLTKDNEIQIKVSHKMDDQGFEISPEPLYITASVGGDTITASIGGDTITAVVN